MLPGEWRERFAPAQRLPRVWKPLFFRSFSRRMVRAFAVQRRAAGTPIARRVPPHERPE